MKKKEETFDQHGEEEPSRILEGDGCRNQSKKMTF